MAKQTLTVQLMHANSRIAELEATLTIARQCYREARQCFRDLRATHATAAPAAHTPTPIVTRFTKRDGSVWEKTRIGNQAVTRCVIDAQPTADELAAHHADQDAQYAAYHS